MIIIGNLLSIYRKTQNNVFVNSSNLWEKCMAADVPLKILKVSTKLINKSYTIAKNANPNCISDIGVANNLIYAGSKGAAYNVLINITDLPTKDKDYYSDQIEYYIKQVYDFHLKIDDILKNKLNFPVL